MVHAEVLESPADAWLRSGMLVIASGKVYGTHIFVVSFRKNALSGFRPKMIV